MVMNIQLHEYTESHRIVQFKCVNCMACELHLEKLFKKKFQTEALGDYNLDKVHRCGQQQSLRLSREPLRPGRGWDDKRIGHRADP